MPRPGPRRRPVPLRMSEDEERPVRELADAEHGGNLSEAIRALLVEALTARQNKVFDTTSADG
jgi:hypothetical protein